MSQRSDNQVSDLLTDRQDDLPVWIRPPKKGYEHYTGLGRAMLYHLADQGEIRSVVIRDPGKIKGITLFLLQSVLDYIERRDSARKKQLNQAKKAYARSNH